MATGKTRTRFTVDGVEVTANAVEAGYIVQFSFKPAQIDNTFKVVATTESGSYEIEASPAAYLYINSNSSNAALANLSKALYTFAKML